MYGWGTGAMLNVEHNIEKAQVLPFLNGLGISGISCCSTHSVAYSGAHCDIFSWGLPGPWLGLDDDPDDEVHDDDADADDEDKDKSRKKAYRFGKGTD